MAKKSQSKKEKAGPTPSPFAVLPADQRLLLAFEYGMNLALSALDLKLELTRPIVERCEKIILAEFKSDKDNQKLAVDMIPNLLAMLEPKN